jgi:hypothetical protein
MKEITQVIFIEFIEKHHPEKLKDNPTIIEIVGNNVVFEMENHPGKFCLNIQS